MPKLTAEVNEITKSVDELAKSAKQAESATAGINTRLKFDSSNVSLVVDRFKALQVELNANNAKLAGLREAQKKLEELRQQTTGTDEKSKKILSEIEQKAQEYARDIERAETNAVRLNEALKQGNKNTQLLRAATLQVQQRYEVLQQASEKVAQSIKKVYTTMKQVVTQASETGLSLTSTAKKYNTTAEDIQTWNYALQLATGQSELFTNSLNVMVKGMSQIASGRGVAYRTALKNIGIAYKDIVELDTAEQFQAIIEALSGVENESKRTAYAQQLLGESGQYISRVLTEGIEALDGYTEKAKAFNIITNSDAEALAEMNIKLQQANSQMTEAKAQLALALQPALEVITDLIRNVLAPAIRNVSEAFKGLGKGGQAVVLGLGGILLVVPKVIGGLTSLKISLLALQTGATTTSVALNLLKTSMIGIGILGAVVGVIGLIGSAFSKTTEETENATDAIEEYKKAAEGLAISGVGVTTNTESVATSMTTSTVNINADIYGHGDTEISDDTAVTVAQLTADEVQKAWGDLIK